MPAKKRVLSGMRATGRMHLGHLVGALENWVKLQDQYQCFFFVADWHALTTDYADTSALTENAIEMVTDWLAAGLDPEKATLFLQSRIPEHAELHLLFSMITPLGWLERVPTYKEQREQMRDKDLSTYGFLGYPVLQAADILIYKAHFVPVGEDQVPHVELTREIARRFNAFYPARMGKKVFPEPGALLTVTSKLPGLDGRKMSKSYGNTIELGDEPETIRQKIGTMLTDPQRVRRTDPGRPEICPVFGYHRRYSPAEVIAQVDHECRTAAIGCVDCKALMAQHLVPVLEPIRERRRTYEARPEAVWEILVEGSKKARRVARRTMVQVREAMKTVFEWERKPAAGRAGRKRGPATPTVPTPSVTRT
ncbi:MAG: tryptophan--tRNA ligase [Terriglobia bacterium]